MDIHFSLVEVKYMEKNLGITKPRYSEDTSPVPCVFVIYRARGEALKASLGRSVPARLSTLDLVKGHNRSFRYLYKTRNP